VLHRIDLSTNRSRKVAGRRYTDEATLAIVVRVLGELNACVARMASRLGGRAIGIDGSDDVLGFPVVGDRLTLPGLDLQPIDLGFVGKVVDVDTGRLLGLLDAGSIPILPSVARAIEGGWLNVNADTAASAVAGALKAEACYFLTDTPGVLRDVKDPGSLIPQLTRSECERLVRDGVIAGGMVPKVEACFEALDAGAGRAVILDGRDPHALLREFCGEPAGTAIVP